MIRSKLSVIMAERGIRQDELSEVTGISKTALSNMANNKTTGIQYDILDKLAIYFGLNIDELFEFSPFRYELSYIDTDDVEFSIATEVNNLGGGDTNVYGQPKRYSMDYGIVISVYTRQLSKDDYVLYFDNVSGSDNKFSTIDDGNNVYIVSDDKNKLEGILDELTPALLQEFKDNFKDFFMVNLSDHFGRQPLLSLGKHHKVEYQIKAY